MICDLDSSKLMTIIAFVARRQDEIVSSICRLVERESPSGDVQGSRAAVTLLEDLARTIPSVSVIERVDSPGYGEHLRIRAFCDDANSDDATLILGHTDTVHPRGSLNAHHGLRA